MRLLAVVLMGSAAFAQVPATDSRDTDIPNTDTHFTARTYGTLAEWQARKAFLRKQILSSVGLLPMPPKREEPPIKMAAIAGRSKGSPIPESAELTRARYTKAATPAISPLAV